MVAIEIKNLSKSFKDIKAIDNLTLNINQGEVFGLLGVNGAGKTTTIKILTGLLAKDNGQISILGFDLEHDLSEIKRIINVSPQETSIATRLSVKENIELMANLYESDKTQVKEKVENLIKMFKLDEVINRRAGTLSGGYQRRLSIAMGLVNNPKILFLDEPTLGLDVISKRELWKIINKIKNQTTIILTTHYLEEAEALCDHIAIMCKGKLKAIGTGKELKEIGHSDNFEEAFINIVEENEDE